MGLQRQGARLQLAGQVGTFACAPEAKRFGHWDKLWVPGAGEVSLYGCPYYTLQAPLADAQAPHLGSTMDMGKPWVHGAG